MEKIKLNYDDQADVLYISIGDPRPGIAIEANDGNFIRYAQGTDKIIGITILDFAERFIPDKIAWKEIIWKENQ